MRRARLDWLLAVALAGLAQIELWLGSEPDKPLLALAALLFTLPLAARRTRPLVALLVALAGLAVLSTKGTDYLTTAQVVALLLHAYSVGAHLDKRPAVAGFVLVSASAVVNTVLADAPEGGDYVFPVVLLAGAWLAGRAAREWEKRALELERLSRELAAQRKQLARLAVAEERARIARELHDAVAHSVNVTIVQAEAAEEVLAQRPEAVLEPLHRIQASGREALTEMRRLLGLLRGGNGDRDPRPPRLADLDTLARNLREAGLAVDLHARGDRRPLPTGVELSAYRIVQEALTNTLKHAHASRADVTVDYGERELTLEVVDDGSQYDAPSNGGHGIVGMRERVALFGGSVEAGPVKDGGFRVRARLRLDT